jgi:hypothetical protein
LAKRHRTRNGKNPGISGKDIHMDKITNFVGKYSVVVFGRVPAIFPDDLESAKTLLNYLENYHPGIKANLESGGLMDIPKDKVWDTICDMTEYGSTFTFRN